MRKENSDTCYLLALILNLNRERIPYFFFRRFPISLIRRNIRNDLLPPDGGHGWVMALDLVLKKNQFYIPGVAAIEVAYCESQIHSPYSLRSTTLH